MIDEDKMNVPRDSATFWTGVSLSSWYSYLSEGTRLRIPRTSRRLNSSETKFIPRHMYVPAQSRRARLQNAL